MVCGPLSHQQCPVMSQNVPLHDEGAHYSAQTYHQLVADVAIEPDAADDYDMACLNIIDSDQSTR